MKYTLLLCALLTGCATVYDKQWSRDGGTPDLLYRETAQCKFDAAGNGGLTSYLYVQCMQGKGWHEVK